MSVLIASRLHQRQPRQQYDETILRTKETGLLTGWNTTFASREGECPSQRDMGLTRSNSTPSASVSYRGIDPGDPEILDIHNIVRR